MGGWTPWPKSLHEELLGLLRAQGPLPAEAIEADLVFLADRANHPNPASRRAFPGRRALERRWGTSERATRNALKSSNWQDMCRAVGIPVPRPRRPCPRGVPTTVPVANGPTPNIVEFRTTTVPAPVHTRVDRTPEPPNPDHDPAPPEEEDPVEHATVIGAKQQASGDLSVQELAELGALEAEANPEADWDWTGSRHHFPLQKLVAEGFTLRSLRELWAEAERAFTRSPPTWRAIAAPGWESLRRKVLLEHRPPLTPEQLKAADEWVDPAIAEMLRAERARKLRKAAK